MSMSDASWSVQQDPNMVVTTDQDVGYPDPMTQDAIDTQRSLRMREAVISHATLVTLLICGGLALAGKGPMWLRSKWTIGLLAVSYIYTLHRAMRETYWLGASDTQATDGGAPIL